MTQAVLFDETLALAGRIDGMSRASRAERVQQWKADAAVWLDGLSAGTEFTADDVVRSVGLPDHGPARNNVVGAWTSSVARRGLIVWTGMFRKSARAVGHGNLQRVWRVK